MSSFDMDRFLDPTPLALETGYERMPDGVLHVACRTDMHRCSGEMFAWWFGSRPDTQKYTWWHPVDHVSSQWLGGQAGSCVGSVHKVEERFAGSPVQQLLIQFRDPGEFFNPSALEAAYRQGRISAAVCARGGQSWDAPRDPNGCILGARLLHVVRDTDWGCVLRTHFFLGYDLPASGCNPEQVQAMVPDAMAPGLLMHCYNEFTFLSRFLPSLFIAENRTVHEVRVPW